MPRIEAYPHISIDDDVQVSASVNGTQGVFTTHTGFHRVHSNKTRTKLGDGYWDINFDVEITTNPDNSIDYVVKNVRWGNYRYISTKSSQDAIPFHIMIDTVEASGSRNRVWDFTLATQNNYEFGAPSLGNFERRGHIEPNQAQNASRNIIFTHYYNDGSIADDEFDLGIAIINDLPPSVRPKAVFDCSTNTWKTTDRANGTIKVFNCGTNTWKEVRTINQGKDPVGMGTGVFNCSKDKYQNMYRIGVE